MQHSPRRHRPGLALLLIALSVGCADVVHPEEGPIESITVEPADPQIQEGAEMRLTARLYAASGAEIQGRSVFWASEDPEVAELGNNGTLRGVKRGTTRVAASAEGKHGVANVRVVPVPVGSIELSPAPLSLAIDEVATLNVVVRDRNGTVVTDRALTWASSATSVAEVNSTGVVTGLVPGRATITATAEGVQGSAEVIVRPGAPASISVVAGNSQQGEAGSALADRLVVRITDAKGNAVPEVQVQWTAQHGSFTSADERTNDGGEASATWVLGSTAGEQRATARAGNLSANFSATAAPRPVARVEVSPDTIIVAARGTRQLQARALDRDGGALTGRSVTWTTGEPTIATVNSSGVVTGVRPGEATITATIEGVAGTARVTVRSGPPATISIISGNAQEARAGTALPDPLVVQVSDVDDNVIANATVQWTTQAGSLSPQSGPTNAEGRASSVWTLGSSPGNQSATASVGNLNAQFSATATETPVGSVEVSPPVVVVGVQATQQMTAVVRDSDGGTLNRPVSWSSSNSNVAQVSGTGLVTGVSPGLATIKATSGGVEGTAEVTVTPGAPAAIAATSGNSQQATAATALPNPLVAKVTDAGGNPVPNVTVQWTAEHGSVQPTSGTTNANGEVATAWTLGPDEGTQRVNATAGSLSVQFTATAVAAPVPVATVEVAPDSADVGIGGQLQLEATLRDANGNILTGRTVGWASSNQVIAQVNSNGRVTAGVLPGKATITATVSTVEGGSVTVAGSAVVRVVIFGPSAISIVSGNGQEAIKQTTLPNPLVVRVTDALGNALQNVTVQWSANRGGSVNPSSSATDSSGHASTSWTLGEPVGVHNVTARVGSLTVTFSATSHPPAGDELSSAGWSSQLQGNLNVPGSPDF